VFSIVRIETYSLQLYIYSRVTLFQLSTWITLLRTACGLSSCFLAIPPHRTSTVMSWNGVSFFSVYYGKQISTVTI